MKLRKVLSIALAALMLASAAALASCGEEKGQNSDAPAGEQTKAATMAEAKSLADLAGKKIAAQAGTFHADALNQIDKVQSSTYPDFTDLLVAVQSGAIDGYIAEEPTAFAVCLGDETLDYVRLVNNDTGFTATDADTGIAVGLIEGSPLRDQINAVLADVTAEQRSALMQQMVELSNGKEIGELAITSEAPAETTGTLKIAMECAYEPFNWTDLNEPTTGAVEIYGSDGQVVDGRFANGYDVQIAQYIANKLGLKLEVYAIEWDSLIPAVQSGVVDGIIAGMSPTAEREEQVDFTNVYYSSNLVVIYKK